MMNVFRHALNVFFTFSAFQKVLSFLIFFRRFSSTVRIACSAWNARSAPQIRFHDFWRYINLYLCMYVGLCYFYGCDDVAWCVVCIFVRIKTHEQIELPLGRRPDSRGPKEQRLHTDATG